MTIEMYQDVMNHIQIDKYRELIIEQDHKITELEKENAELKEKVNILDNCDRLGDVITEAYKDQLTKAKEIIKNLVEFDSSYKDDEEYQRKSELYDKIWEEAEQFLNEVEK